MAFRDGALGRWLDLDGRILMVGKESWSSLLSAMWRYREDDHCKPRIVSSPDIRSGTDLGLPSPNTMRNKYLFLLPSLWCYVVTSRMNTYSLDSWRTYHRITGMSTTWKQSLPGTSELQAHFTLRENSSNLWRSTLAYVFPSYKHCWLLRSLFNWRGCEPFALQVVLFLSPLQVTCILFKL